ncbi:glycosyl hydrolase catalytic core-domain-containing protein [Mycena polygramma]|nr:glycosyl hydrolase catalytic core-domain-containing protein [Mycena polygramma]
MRDANFDKGRLRSITSETTFVPLALEQFFADTPSVQHGPGKRGLAWPYYNGKLDPGRLNDRQGTVNLIFYPTCNYDYETYAPPSSNANHGLHFIGMQRCLDCDSSPISQLAALFTLNEPDLNGARVKQRIGISSISTTWFAIKKALPAVTSSNEGGKGLNWVQQMVNACGGGCYFDYINLHWYGQNFEQFKAHINDAHARFPHNKIVITEFALQNPRGGQTDQINFFKQAFAFLDSASFVEMYFPFVATSPSLFKTHDPQGANYVGTGSTLYNDDGSISAVGQLLLRA